MQHQLLPVQVCARLWTIAHVRQRPRELTRRAEATNNTEHDMQLKFQKLEEQLAKEREEREKLAKKLAKKLEEHAKELDNLRRKLADKNAGTIDSADAAHAATPTADKSEQLSLFYPLQGVPSKNEQADTAGFDARCNMLMLEEGDVDSIDFAEAKFPRDADSSSVDNYKKLVREKIGAAVQSRNELVKAAERLVPQEVQDSKSLEDLKKSSEQWYDHIGAAIMAKTGDPDAKGKLAELQVIAADFRESLGADQLQRKPRIFEDGLNEATMVSVTVQWTKAVFGHAAKLDCMYATEESKAEVAKAASSSSRSMPLQDTASSFADRPQMRNKRADAYGGQHVVLEAQKSNNQTKGQQDLTKAMQEARDILSLQPVVDNARGEAGARATPDDMSDEAQSATARERTRKRSRARNHVHD